MRPGNPFTLSFGKSPEEYISRIPQTDEILRTFREEKPSNQVYMLTGVRGSGKTVMMTQIADELGSDSDWIVLNLNPERDLLNAMASKLYVSEHLQPAFTKARIDLSLLGIGLSIEGATPVSDIEMAIDRMLRIVKNKKKRVLITIDEVTNNDFVRVFVSSFQIMIRQDFPVFLLMTGLFENINLLQNEKSLTFLYRAPKVPMDPLDKMAVSDIMNNLSLNKSNFSPYRDRLLKKGIVIAPERGKLSIVLPRFDKFVQLQ